MSIWLLHGGSTGIQSDCTPQIFAATGILARVALDLVMKNLASGIFAGNHQGDLQWKFVYTDTVFVASRKLVIYHEVLLLELFEFPCCMLKIEK
jgi:hypothetical protein